MAQMASKVRSFAKDKISKLEKPEANVEDVDLKGVTREWVTYEAQVSIMNPYGHSSIPICEVSYTLKSANKVIASGTMPDPGSLEANKTTMLNIPLKVAFGVLTSLAKDIGADWDIDYELELGLTFDLPVAGKFDLPLSNKGEIKLPSFSDVF